MSRILLLMRHGQAETKRAGESDQQRRLDSQGREEVRRAGEWLRKQGLSPDIALVSSATRTLETLDGLRPFLVEPTIKVKPDLYLAPASVADDCLTKLDDSVQCAALIGHNPGLMDLALSFAADEASRSHLLNALFPTAGVALFQIEGAWSDRRVETGRAVLKDLWVWTE